MTVDGESFVRSVAACRRAAGMWHTTPHLHLKSDGLKHLVQNWGSTAEKRDMPSSAVGLYIETASTRDSLDRTTTSVTHLRLSFPADGGRTDQAPRPPRRWLLCGPNSLDDIEERLHQHLCTTVIFRSVPHQTCRHRLHPQRPKHSVPFRR
jgi:hypothetical protein